MAVGDLNMTVNEAVHQGEFKSHQWFGATVRVHEDSVLVRSSYSYFRLCGKKVSIIADINPLSNHDKPLFPLEYLFLNPKYGW